jgi:hypothetical protein
VFIRNKQNRGFSSRCGRSGPCCVRYFEQIWSWDVQFFGHVTFTWIAKGRCGPRIECQATAVWRLMNVKSRSSRPHRLGFRRRSGGSHLTRAERGSMALDHRITRRARFTSTPQCTCLYDRRLSEEGKSHAGGSSRSSEQRVRFARLAGLRLPRKALNPSMKSWPRQPFKPLRAQPRRSGRGRQPGRSYANGGHIPHIDPAMGPGG